MNVLSKLGHYGRAVRATHAYLREPPWPNAESRIREQLENREQRWLDILERVVFSSPDHPYYQMFQLAGCSFGDVERCARRDGLEVTLTALREAGVYLTHAEFKGHEPIVRQGRQIAAAGPDSFVNPLVSGGFETSSGGSRSKGVKTRSSTAFRLYYEAYNALSIREFGLLERAHIEVKPVLPAGAGLGSVLGYSRLGLRVDRWFAVGGPMEDSAHYRALTNYLVAVARLHGVKAPFPTHLPANDFAPAARWLADRKREGIGCSVGSYTSPAVRVAAAARDCGLDISGTQFFASGETLTDGKQELIESLGCEVRSRYHIAEVGPVGYGCRQMRNGGCVHLFSDSLAVISCRRLAPLADVEVDSLHFTNLLDSAPYVLINAEMDDSGVLEPARCDCVFSAAGFRTRIRDIASFGKLTGQGMTLVGADVVQVLEKALPERFGGSPSDYQLVEAEVGDQTQLTLRASPRLKAAQPEELKRFFLQQVAACYGGSLASRVWRHSDALQVVSAEPFLTSSGKVLPLHLLRDAKSPKKHAAQTIS